MAEFYFYKCLPGFSSSRLSDSSFGGAGYAEDRVFKSFDSQTEHVIWPVSLGGKEGKGIFPKAVEQISEEEFERLLSIRDVPRPGSGWDDKKFEKGKVLVGTNESKSMTGKHNLVKSIGFFIDGIPLAIARDLHVFSLKESAPRQFTEVKELEMLDEKQNRQLNTYNSLEDAYGFTFGDILPKAFDVSGRSIFIGRIDGGIRVAHPYKARSTTEIKTTLFGEGEFLEMLSNNDEKRLTVCYLNNDGKTVKTKVNSMDEIKDMKQKLYTITN